MYGLLHASAKWLEGTAVGTEIRTTHIYPYIQLIHFSGLLSNAEYSDIPRPRNAHFEQGPNVTTSLYYAGLNKSMARNEHHCRFAAFGGR
jgi:hypothetical protein